MEQKIIDTPDKEDPGFTGYAGFWLRFAAAIIDSIVLFIVNQAVSNPILRLGGIHPPAPFDQSHQADVRELIMHDPNVTLTKLLEAAMGMTIQQYSIMVIVYFAVNVLYFSIMESSPLMATLGKMAVRAKVT